MEGPGNVPKYGYGQLTKKLQLYDSGSTLFLGIESELAKSLI